MADLAERLTGPPSRLVARLALRLLGAATVAGFAFGVAGWSPGTVGVAVGALTWLAAGTRINDRGFGDHNPQNHDHFR
jgi:hypothetical protein